MALKYTSYSSATQLSDRIFFGETIQLVHGLCIFLVKLREVIPIVVSNFYFSYLAHLCVGATDALFFFYAFN